MKLFAVIFGLIFSTHLWSLPDDRNQLAKLTADSAELNQQNHFGHYQGHVEFDQGTTHLRASDATTQGDDKHQLTLAIAAGSFKYQAHYWEKIALDKPELHAYANKIYYYPLIHQIKLIGNARVVQGDNILNAPIITYDTEKKHVLTEHDGASRTTIILNLKKKP